MQLLAYIDFFFTQNGLIMSGDKSLMLEELHENHPDYHRHQELQRSRSKRFAGVDDSDADGHIVIYESEASGGECGIRPQNAKRMRAPEGGGVVKLGERLRLATHYHELCFFSCFNF